MLRWRTRDVGEGTGAVMCFNWCTVFGEMAFAQKSGDDVYVEAVQYHDILSNSFPHVANRVHCRIAVVTLSSHSQVYTRKHKQQRSLLGIVFRQRPSKDPQTRSTYHLAVLSGLCKL